MSQQKHVERWLVLLLAVLALAVAGLPSVQAQEKKPNILVIMGDDIGWFNPSVYHRGIMGYETPNIDRIAQEGAMFTSWYGQQSCTAGRAAFVTGQSPIRTGLTKGGCTSSRTSRKSRTGRPASASTLTGWSSTTGTSGNC
jgi:arylsulfatase A-like enzyme